MVASARGHESGHAEHGGCGRLPVTESLARRVLRELEELDVAVYQAVEATPTPLIDVPLRRISTLANHAELYAAIAGVLFVVGGRRGRRAAVTGMAAVGLNSAIVNIPMKFAGGRPRPSAARCGSPRRDT